MAKMCYITDHNSLRKEGIVKGAQYLLGDEACAWYLYHPEILADDMGYIINQGAFAAVTLPYLTLQREGVFALSMRRLYPFVKKNAVEFIINDWGYISLFQGMALESASLALGRLLSGQSTDPRAGSFYHGEIQKASRHVLPPDQMTQRLSTPPILNKQIMQKLKQIYPNIGEIHLDNTFLLPDCKLLAEEQNAPEITLHLERIIITVKYCGDRCDTCPDKKKIFYDDPSFMTRLYWHKYKICYDNKVVPSAGGNLKLAYRHKKRTV